MNDFNVYAEKAMLEQERYKHLQMRQSLANLYGLGGKQENLTPNPKQEVPKPKPNKKLLLLEDV